MSDKIIKLIEKGIGIITSTNITEKIVDTKDLVRLGNKLSWHKTELDSLNENLKKLEIEFQYEKDESKLKYMLENIEELNKKKAYSEYRIPELKRQIEAIKSH